MLLETNESNVKKKALSNLPIEVCNVYHLNKKIPEDGIYIGRANRNLNLQGSLFANPFAMKDQSEDERTRVVTEYKDWLWKQIADNTITKNNLLTLCGKKLCCFCAPKNCHGNVLKETVELLVSNEAEFDNKVDEVKSFKLRLNLNPFNK